MSCDSILDLIPSSIKLNCERDTVNQLHSCLRLPGKIHEWGTHPRYDDERVTPTRVSTVTIRSHLCLPSRSYKPPEPWFVLCKYLSRRPRSRKLRRQVEKSFMDVLSNSYYYLSKDQQSLHYIFILFCLLVIKV